MKFKSFLIATLAIGLFTACSNSDDDGPDPTAGGGEPATLTLILDLPAQNRAATAETLGDFNDGNTEEGKRIQLSDMMIFVADQSGTIIDKSEVLTDITNYTGAGKAITTTTTAKRVYIVGNLGAPTNYSTLKGQTSLSGLQAEVTAQSAINQTGGENDKLIVAGYNINDDNSTELKWSKVGDDWTAETSVKMEPISAKLNITVKNNMKNYLNPSADGAYVIESLSVLYSAKSSHLVTKNRTGANTSGMQYAVDYATSSTSKYYTSGLSTWNTYVAEGDAANPYTEVANTELKTEWPTTFQVNSYSPSATENADQTFQHTFYVYPGLNSGNDKPLIVTLKATAPGKTDMYYSIILDKNNHLKGKTPEYPANGHLYQIEISLSGKAETGSGGTDDPEIPSTSGDVTVKVTEAKWIVVGEIKQNFE